MMTTLALVLLLQGAPPAGAPAEARTLNVSVTDDKGAPVTGLRAEEVVVLENGVAREVSKLEPETRPLLAAVIVDSSEPVGTLYRLNVVDAVVRFLARLPEGSRYALWTTGDRPTKVVDFTDDRVRAGAALKRAFPRGGNTLLDAIVEASEDLKQREGQRTAVVVVSGNGLGFSNYDRLQVVERALKNAHTTPAWGRTTPWGAWAARITITSSAPWPAAAGACARPRCRPWAWAGPWTRSPPRWAASIA
jgi:hypothetical protein